MLDRGIGKPVQHVESKTDITVEDSNAVNTLNDILNDKTPKRKVPRNNKKTR